MIYHRYSIKFLSICSFAKFAQLPRINFHGQTYSTTLHPLWRIEIHGLTLTSEIKNLGYIYMYGKVSVG